MYKELGKFCAKFSKGRSRFESARAHGRKATQERSIRALCEVVEGFAYWVEHYDFRSQLDRERAEMLLGDLQYDLSAIRRDYRCA